MTVKSDVTYRNLLSDMLSLMRIHQSRKGWTVILCPSDTVALACARLLSTLIPVGTKFSGRTAALPTGNLSVACASDPVFPAGKFALAYIGWGDDNGEAAEVGQWRSKATEIISSQTL